MSSTARSDRIRADLNKRVRDGRVPYGALSEIARKHGVTRVWVQRLANQLDITGSRRKDRS